MHVTDEMVEAAYDGWRKAPIGAPMEHVESRRRRCIRAALEAALRAAPAAEPQCCMCGKTGLSTVEGDGGSECQLSDGRWTCSFECWERATERDAPPAPVADGEAKRHAIELEQCSLFVDSAPLTKAMTDAAAYLRRTAAAALKEGRDE